MFAARAVPLFAAGGLLLACQRPEISSPATTTASELRTSSGSEVPQAMQPMAAEPVTPKASPQPCSSLAWSRAEPPRAKVPSIVGTLTDARATDAAGEWTRYFILELERPVCDSDGKTQSELQLVPGKGANLATLAALSGRRVQVEGDASEVQTQEDQLPVVLHVRSVRAR